VTHEHELELAAAALDFELTPAERARLDKAITECSVCARAALAYRRQATLLQALPVVDASAAVRMHVERAAGLRPQRTPWTWALLAAALLGLVLTGVLIAGSNLNRQNPIVEVAPTPVPTATPAPSIAPSPDVIALDPPSGELANVGPPLTRDSLALVVTDNLRLRSAPFVGDLSVRHKRLLQPDDRLFIVDGPVIAQNYEWYQVKAWRPRQPSVSWPIGWVARAGHDGEVWLRASSGTCPSQPVDIAALLELAPVERLGCLRDAPIEVRTVIADATSIDCDTAREGCPTGPDWLASGSLTTSTSASELGSPPGMEISFAPDSRVTAADLAGAGVVRLHGAFDHPDATLCRPDPGRPGPDGPLSSVEAVLRCRSTFVVTDAVVEPFPRRSNVAAVTVSDRLRVRSLPEISDSSIRYEPLVRLGSRLWVLDGPTLADGYAWYQVVVPIPGSGGTVSRWLTGWVAAAGLDGERWLENATIECPDTDRPTLADLARVRQRPVDDGPLACYGSAEIRIDGLARLHCADAPSGDPATGWLSDGAGRWLEIVDGKRRLEARVAPGAFDGVACDQPLRRRYRVTGHFDDPAAADCRSAGAAVPGATDARVAIYRCRTHFVATDAVPLGATASPNPLAPRG
jgi:hypothetical protein